MIDFRVRRDGCEHPSYGVLGRRYYVGIASVFGRWIIAALVTCLSAAGAQAKQAEICSDPADSLEVVCGVYSKHCSAFLEDASTLDRASLEPVPERASKWVASTTLSKDVLGYLRTENDFVSVVYYDKAPACELLMTGLLYSQLSRAFFDWRAGEGAGFAMVGDFEPRSSKRISRAFATVFLAARRADEKVTEVTFNWNLNASGLTRLKVSVQPERPYTTKLLSRGSE